MKTATISYTKNHLSELLVRVRRGETVTILDRTRPVARLVPVPSTGDEDLDRRLDEMERQGIIRRGTGRVPDWILKEPPPRPKSGWSAVDAIIEERREGR
jgi:prevent-host-death family protein